ncbi:Rsm22-domain-containing protein [Trametes coccinea BRFM310]|uniref:Rsm22-domain-containing protein n=1 Tax=Trametes coccinea (strain BRFM310) TaxID=1353009 RepID=A0A1Y2J125_TRAC3|nr:Rsm22-domain-containing protein [Trametes coccinea BRFM310]
MLRLGCKRTLAFVLRRHHDVARWSSTSAHQPNAPLDLDPAFQALLKDVGMSLRNKVKSDASGSHGPRELEVYPHDPEAPVDYLSSAELDAQDEGFGHKERRKSPAAHFGSQRIGAVVLPFELESTIGRMVADSDKSTLHQDAKRLFFVDTNQRPEWDPTYDVKYKSGRAAGKHSLRDATAFATVALPSHYAAIYAVLDHVKQRLGPEWQVERVIDWGAATGSGLWASGHTFQGNSHERHSPDMAEIQISQTSLSSYLGIDKREGLVRIGKRLIRDVEMGGLDVAWQKSFHEDNIVDRTDGAKVLAMSAFLLSSLPSPIERKALVKEMWDSGAEVMILIDHDFEAVAEARLQFLKLGQKELEDPSSEQYPLRGSHVVAPCPHDGACPLYQPGHSKLVCSFSQRLQRPEFVRKTKHSGTGHENMDYSYVVIRRGPRPSPATTKVGRIGEVGRRELIKQAEESVPVTQLSIEGESAALESVEEFAADDTSAEPLENGETALTTSELDAALRHEAYSWPRLVFPPLKRSGHIILDGCTAEGQIMRMTIPKSQGKQPFYDARKSEWGDLFPHEPKNKPQVRHQPLHPGHTPSLGQDIGKRRRKDGGKQASYSELSAQVRERRREQRRARRLAEWDED